MKEKNTRLVDRSRFFAQIGGKPYAVSIIDNRHFDYEEPRCIHCRHSVFTECTAKHVPPERLSGLHFYPEIVIDREVKDEVHFEICDHCGFWYDRTFIGTIGEMPKVYTVCRYIPANIEMTISYEFAETVELVFWDRDENICNILYELKSGNEEYFDRISKGALTADEQAELFKIIAESETK